MFFCSFNNKVGGASKQSTIRGYRWGEYGVRISVPRTQYHARATMKYIYRRGAAGVIFLLIAVEVLGDWYEEAIFHISKIGRLMGQRLGLPPNETTKHLFQRLAICLWKGNALLWSHRFPPPSAWVDGII